MGTEASVLAERTFPILDHKQPGTQLPLPDALKVVLVDAPVATCLSIGSIICVNIAQVLLHGRNAPIFNDDPKSVLNHETLN